MSTNMTRNALRAAVRHNTASLPVGARMSSTAKVWVDKVWILKFITKNDLKQL